MIYSDYASDQRYHIKISFDPYGSVRVRSRLCPWCVEMYIEISSGYEGLFDTAVSRANPVALFAGTARRGAFEPTNDTFTRSVFTYLLRLLRDIQRNNYC